MNLEMYLEMDPEMELTPPQTISLGWMEIELEMHLEIELTPRQLAKVGQKWSWR